MKKVVLGAVLVLLITIGGGVYLLLSNLDQLVKSAIETYGSQATQTPVRVEKVKFGLQEGSGAISGLTVGNPPGFIDLQIFSLGEIATRIDLKSLTEDVIVIDQISVRGAEVFFELNAEGKTNLNEFKQRLPSAGAGSTASAPPVQSSGGEPRLLIRKLLFSDGSIHARVVPLRKDYELKLPSFELANLGGKEGVTPTQIADRVLKVLTERALAEIKKQGLDQYREKLEGELKQQLDVEKQKLEQKLNDKVGQEVGDKLKGLLNY